MKKRQSTVEKAIEAPVYQMSSFSRSGETLMQRCLQAHPQIEVVHQIREPDSPEDLELFSHLRFSSGPSDLDIESSLLAHRKISRGTVLLLKNAVWTHRGARRGFVLIRNPFSVVVSAYRHTANPESDAHQRSQQLRWCRTIDRHMIPFIEKSDNLTGWLVLYNRKMMHDRRSGLPFVRYEDFVADPEPVLRRIVAHLGLEWSPRVLESHLDYKEGEIGHGNIKLWQPIHTGSVDKYKTLSPDIASQVYSLTSEVLRAYGYGWNGEEITLSDVKGML